MANSKISVIVPVYNTEKYVEATVRSLMNQTYRNIEIICVNDGSTDGSLEILERLQKEDDRIVVLTKENGGLGDTRNYGIAHSTSEWLSFIDSDDTVHPDTYRLVAEAIEYGPDLIHFGIEVVCEDGSEPTKGDKLYYSIKEEGLVELTDSKILGADVSASNKVFRKSKLEELGLRFQHIRYEDFAFTVPYALMSEKIFYIKQPLYFYLRRAGSIMSETFSKSPYAIDHIHAYKFVLDFLKSKDQLDVHRRIMAKYFMACYTFCIRYSTYEMMPEVVKYADAIFASNSFLKNKLVRKERSGTVLYHFKENRFRVSSLLHGLFSVKYEYIDYRLYKAVRIFGILVYKSPRR